MTTLRGYQSLHFAYFYQAEVISMEQSRVL